LFRRPPIVAVQEGDDFASALRDAMIKSRSLTTIGFAKYPDLGSESTQNLWGTVGRTIVHNEDFTLGNGKILCQGACDRLFDEALMVIRINQYADEDSCHSVISTIRRCAKKEAS